jgi:hypothetical protein
MIYVKHKKCEELNFSLTNKETIGIKNNIKQKELLKMLKEWMKKELEELKTEEPVYLFYT